MEFAQSRIPFKGPILAATTYGDLGIRQSCDLDILVQFEDFLHAIQVLESEGNYRFNHPISFLNEIHARIRFQIIGECTLSNGIVNIDLHHRLTVEQFLSSHFTFEYLWSHRQSYLVSGHKIFSFDPETLLLYLCIHGSKDCWKSLKWICDIAEYIQIHPTLNWDHLVQESIVLGCRRRLFLGVYLAHYLLNAALPEPVLKQINEDENILLLAKEISLKLFNHNTSLGDSFNYKRFCFHFQIVETRSDKWGCVLDLHRYIYAILIRVIPREVDRDFLPLPRSFYFLYFLIRPLRILIERLRPRLRLPG